ncbi:hypothetical protein ACE1TF_05725 [Geomicrobium sp. JSM 1781026]|uniref:hypothetical protein n=1 Tax=Geomicrobium sp. JSM 1781026 TaxID=3344580 RepID=UPI0035BEFDA0
MVLAVLWKASMCLPSVGIRKRLVGWSQEQVVNSLLRLMAEGSVRAQIIEGTSYYCTSISEEAFSKQFYGGEDNE